MIMIPANHTRTSPCMCDDAAMATLRELVDAGHSQTEVSHLLWGDPGRASVATRRAVDRAHTRHRVRSAFTAAVPVAPPPW